MNLLTSTSPAVVAFVAGIQKINDDAGCDRTYAINEGARYLKVVAHINSHLAAGIKGGSAYCFIDRATGDLLKTASWASPAKGARGNVNDSNPFITASPYGFGYRR
jgi:hypothetical protein